jgi:uroporphyrinogen-III synthase
MNSIQIKRERTSAGPGICHRYVMALLTFRPELAVPYTWIITKSQPHADSVVIQLRRQAINALAIPCIEHQWRDWPELRRVGAAGAAILFVTSRAAAARIDVPQGVNSGVIVAAITPTTSATLEARGIRVGLTAKGGVRDLAQAVHDSPLVPDGADVFYPTSDVALRQPEHLNAVDTLSRRLAVHTNAVYSTVAPANLAQELAALRANVPPLGYCFWSPSAVGNFAAADGFGLEPGPVVLVGGSTERCWRETAPAAWRRAFKHDAETPLEWSLRFLERGGGGS